MNEEVQEDPTGVRALWDRGNMNGAPQKLEILANFYIGDMITTLQKASLVPGSDDSLVYTTISGSIGMLVPFISRDVSSLKVLMILINLNCLGIRIFPNT